jgi:hypothetical protein
MQATSAHDAVPRPGNRSSRRARVAVSTVGVLVLAGIASLALTRSDAAVSPIPLTDERAAAVVRAATACPALNPGRLAGQLMATTGFQETVDTGVSGLTLAQWEAWKPDDTASPADDAASLLALAHLTCDLVGQVRVAGIPGNPWRLAVAALRTSLVDVDAANGEPAAMVPLLNEAEEFAAWYAQQPNLGGTPSPTPSTSPSPSPSRSPVASPSPSPSLSLSRSGPPTTTPATTTTTRAPGSSVRIDYPTFGTADGLTLNGAARVAGGRLDLTTGLAQAGSAWSTSTVDPGRPLTCTFVAVISTWTDGVAFVIQAEGPRALGGMGDAIGYGGNTAQEAIRPSVAIELDTWDNSPDGFDPPRQQHIALTLDGDQKQHVTWADPGFDMVGRDVHVWVTYDAQTHTLRVYASAAANRPANPLISATLDLRARLGGPVASVGFTGGTGRTNLTDSHESISSWSLTSS